MSTSEITLEMQTRILYICQYLGKDKFLELVIETLYRASENTKNLDETISVEYEKAACLIQDLLDQIESAA